VMVDFKCAPSPATHARHLIEGDISAFNKVARADHPSATDHNLQDCFSADRQPPAV
jgi:hypothetical protein